MVVMTVTYSVPSISSSSLQPATALVRSPRSFRSDENNTNPRQLAESLRREQSNHSHEAHTLTESSSSSTGPVNRRSIINGVIASAAAAAAFLAGAGSAKATASSTVIKMGADEGTLVFVPSSVTVIAGDKVTFLNNKGFPHNIIFEKDGVPEGVKSEQISHEDYMNDQGEQFTVLLKEKGTYKYFCEPHRSAGMYGEIIVN